MEIFTYNILHDIIHFALMLMIVALLVRVILSWLPFLPPGNPIVRFFNRLTDPILQPIMRRVPRASVGMFDISYTVAIIFVWWVLIALDQVFAFALPPGW